MSGLTSTGLEIETFEQILNKMQETFQSRVGIVDFTEASDPLYQTFAVTAEAAASLWQLFQAVYGAQNPATASGISLDNVAMENGITRLTATSSTVTAKLTGMNEIVVPAGSEIGSLGISTSFRLETAVVLDAIQCIAATIALTSITPASFTITINSVNYTYEQVAGDNIDTILENLSLLIINADLGISCDTTSKEGSIILTSDNENSFSVSIGSQSQVFTITDVSNFGNFIAAEKGAIIVPSFALSNILTPYAGWFEVVNLEPGLTGRDLETDAELRKRRFLDLKIGGASNLDAIRARVANVAGVTSVSAQENVTDKELNGLPPHSFQILVVGGQDLDIANEIWRAKPGGIQPFGTTSVNILDSEDNVQVVSFSRASSLYIYVSIDLTLDDTNSFTDDSSDIIKQNIVDQIADLEVGEDVIYQKLFSAVYAVAGISNANIKIGGTTDEGTVPSESASNIIVGSNLGATTDISKIEISIV